MAEVTQLRQTEGSVLMGKQAKLIKILFLAADPTDAARLRLGEEQREIRERLQLSKNRQRFALESRDSVRPGDLTQAIFDVSPQIIHFSGHGTQSGELCLEDSRGGIQPVTPVALHALFKLMAGSISCVILNACYSAVQAKVISQHVPHVIGMSKEIGDDAAIVYAAGFYKALGADRSIPEAHDYGCAEMLLQGIQENVTPVLLAQDQFNELPSVSCDKEDDLRSLNSDFPVRVRFTNHTDATVKAYWLDYTGRRQHYFDMRTNETVTQFTYATHPWVLTKGVGERHICIGIFIPNETDGVVILR